MSKVLFVAVHPDDETLGCGGTILKHKRQGDKVSWLILTGIKDAGHNDAQRIRSREQEIKKVGKMYGFEHIHPCNFPTTKLDTIPMNDLVAKISEAVHAIKPEIIYLPNRSDIHSDHRVAFQAAVSCTKNFRYPFVKKILMYETLSETDFSPAVPENAFVPNVFVDVTPYFEKKLKIMSVFASEVMKSPYPRSLRAIRALGQLRGARIGKDYAEAFMLIQEIV